MHEYEAKVTRLFRYNSIELTVDLGFGNYMSKKFKILDMPEPEIEYPTDTIIDDINKRKTIVSEITQKLTRFVSKYLLNKEIIVNVEKIGKDSYGIKTIKLKINKDLDFRSDFTKMYNSILEEYLNYE